MKILSSNGGWYTDDINWVWTTLQAHGKENIGNKIRDRWAFHVVVSSISPIKIESSTQPNSTIFQTSIKSSQFGIYENRTQYLTFNNNKPFLNFFKIRILLNPDLKRTFRSFKKFATFLAEVTSILSNLLMICAIIMIRYNSIQGNNNMIMSIFSHNSIKNLKLFKDDFKPIFEERNKYISFHQEKKNNNVRVSAIDISLICPFVEESNHYLF